MTQTLGTYEGMTYSVKYHDHGGFQLIVTNEESGETIFDQRMLMYSLYEAILDVTSRFIDDDMAGQIAADQFGIAMRFFDDEDDDDD